MFPSIAQINDISKYLVYDHLRMDIVLFRINGMIWGQKPYSNDSTKEIIFWRIIETENGKIEIGTNQELNEYEIDIIKMTVRS